MFKYTSSRRNGNFISSFYCIRVILPPVCPQDAVFNVVERVDVASDAVRCVGEELVPWKETNSGLFTG